MHGRPTGILMLDTQFARLPGDAGNPATWPFPVRIGVVKGASVSAVVDRGASGLESAFITAAREMIERDRVDAITTTCGFLAVHQRTMAASLDVPVATSSLLQVPSVERLLPPGRRAGIVTFDRARLTPDILAAAGAAVDTPIAGLPPDGRFHGYIRRSDTPERDALAVEIEEVVATFLDRHSEVGALVLECANLPTFSAALARRFRLPVFDIVTLINWLRSAIAPAEYGR
jgi:hypothetical protein